MSMPRRSMQEMGFQSCCLQCDAPDVAGSERCRSCMDRHVETRRWLDDIDPESEVGQLGRELLQMISNPHRWDHDDVHGDELKRIQHLAGTLAEPKPMPTSEEIGDIFATQASVEKGSLIRDIANRNLWKDAPPSPGLAREMGAELSVDSSLVPGQRTIPSKEIVGVDRSDRLGEDRDISDRVAVERGEADSVEERVKARREWSVALDSVEDILSDDVPVDDDLDL